MTTREKIVALAENLIHQHGYAGFSYKDIARELQIQNAAIHYHFPSKADLGLAVIEAAQKRFEHWDDHMHNRSIDDWQKVDNFFKIYDGNCYKESRMCLVGSLCSNYPLLPEKMQSALTVFVEDIKRWFTGVLENGRSNGSFSFNGDASDRASIIQTSLMGALLINRVLGAAEYEKIKNQLIKDIKHGI